MIIFRRNAIIFFSVLITGCEGNSLFERTLSFGIKNNSSHSVYMYFADGNSSAYPDTTIPVTQNLAGPILPGNLGKYTVWSNSFRKVFDRLPKDTLSVFVFHADTLKKYSWSEIRSGYKVLKRYDLSYSDITTGPGLKYP